MTTETERATPLTRFVDKVQHEYPYGIPRHLLVQAGPKRDTQTPQVAACSGRVLFLIASAESELSLAEQQLLNSIVTKGLLLPESDFCARVCVLSEVADLAEWRARTVEGEQGVNLVISMGLNLGLENGMIESSPVKTLHTVSLSEVIVSKEAKRLFWGHLQKLLVRGEGSL
jgi:hypothetical protein